MQLLIQLSMFVVKAFKKVVALSGKKAMILNESTNSFFRVGGRLVTTQSWTASIVVYWKYIQPQLSIRLLNIGSNKRNEENVPKSWEAFQDTEFFYGNLVCVFSSEQQISTRVNTTISLKIRIESTGEQT